MYQLDCTLGQLRGGLGLTIKAQANCAAGVLQCQLHLRWIDAPMRRQICGLLGIKPNAQVTVELRLRCKGRQHMVKPDAVFINFEAQLVTSEPIVNQAL